jgi:RecA-family ATPase
MREAKVLVIDGASDAYGASEIVRRHVRYYIRALRRLVPQDGACLLLAHVDKSTAKNAETTQGYSGSTAWNNSVRARWYLRSEGEDGGLLLELVKANHAVAGAQIRLRWDPVAMLYVADAAPTEGGMVKGIRERQEREGIVAALKACSAAGEYVPAATSGRRTAFNVLSVRPEFPQSLRNSAAGSRLFWQRIEELRQMRLIREESIRRKNRHYRDVLVASTEGSAECAE